MSKAAIQLNLIAEFRAVKALKFPLTRLQADLGRRCGVAVCRLIADRHQLVRHGLQANDLRIAQLLRENLIGFARQMHLPTGRHEGVGMQIFAGALAARQLLQKCVERIGRRWIVLNSHTNL